MGDQCIRCGNSLGKYLLGQNGQELGPYDKLCAFERNFKEIPVYKNYPSNLSEFIYRLFIRKNLPNNPELINKVNSRVLQLFFYLIVFILTSVFFYYQLSLLPELALIFIALYILVGIIISMFEMEGNNIFTKRIDEWMGVLNSGERLYIQTPPLKFHLIMIKLVIFNIILVPFYLFYILFMGMFFSLIPFIFLPMSLILAPISILTIIFSPVKAIKGFFKYVIMKPARFIKEQSRSIFHVYYRGLQLKPDQKFSPHDTFEKIWNNELELYNRPGSFNFIILLITLPIHLLVIFLSLTFELSRNLLSLILYLISELIHILLGNNISFDLSSYPLIITFANILGPILLLFLIQWGMSKVDNFLWKRYSRLVVMNQLPQGVETLKQEDNKKIRPVPTVLTRSGYDKDFWEFW